MDTIQNNNTVQKLNVKRVNTREEEDQPRWYGQIKV